jgi:hypothetical protein
MPSDLFYQDDIIYDIRGTALRAMVIQSGKLLWDMPSLDGNVENRKSEIFRKIKKLVNLAHGRLKRPSV